MDEDMLIQNRGSIEDEQRREWEQNELYKMSEYFTED